ncbi:MAG: hypothetical protein KatS3mg057_2700 [Herpetosiphonaceae bacterium]|nr:MAG: hypothetical protein KatS3mg057_2700 [Herpetosiphonaceae bacterium]
MLAQHGGGDALLAECLVITEYNGDNYLPLLPPLYYASRQVLFRLLNLLEIAPTTLSSVMIFKACLGDHRLPGKLHARVYDPPEEEERASFALDNGEEERLVGAQLHRLGQLPRWY